MSQLDDANRIPGNTDYTEFGNEPTWCFDCGWMGLEKEIQLDVPDPDKFEHYHRCPRCGSTHHTSISVEQAIEEGLDVALGPDINRVTPEVLIWLQGIVMMMNKEKYDD